MKNMKISTRLIASFIIITIITLSVGVIGFYGVTNLEGYIHEIAGTRLPRIQSLLTISEAQTAIRSAQRTILSTSITNEEIAQQIDDITKINQRVEKAKTIIESTPLIKEEREAWNEFKTAYGAWDSQCKTFLGMASDYMENKSSDKYVNLDEFAKGDMETSFVQVSNFLQDMVDVDKEIARSTNEEANKHAIMIEYMTIGVMLGGVILSVILGLLLSRSIYKSLNEIVEKLTQSSNQVATASVQMATAGRQLSEGSTEQAASIEETSATIDETSSMIKQNAVNTKQANELAQQATMAATDGAGKMQDMITSMEELKKSSDDIAKIIKVIDEIAFQTNMLALNAAVEAARAGDVGQGFAVVAQEVRNLAQKSAQAAKDTEEIIDRNIELSEQGATISLNVNDSLSEIMAKTENVNQLISEITVASQEQARGASQIAEGMAQMEKVVQNNASTAEESATSAEDLKNQTDELNDIVMMLNRLVKGKKATRKIEDNESQEQDQVEINFDEKIPHDEMSAEEHIITPDDIIPLNEDDEF